MHKKLLLIGLAYLAFISLGLPDGLLGVAWPSIRATFGLRLDALGTLLLAFTGGYLFSSASSGRALARMSVGALLALSCLATALALLGTAATPRWWGMVALAALSGLGGGAIDAGLNTYVATQYSARTLNWLHAFFGVGATLGPLIMASVLAADMPWRVGYLLVGAGQLALAACFALTRRRWHADPSAAVAQEPVAAATSAQTLRLPAAWLGIATFFCYTGVEVAAGQWSYSLLTESRGVLPATASAAVSVYWASLTAGRVIFGLIVGLAPLALLLRLSLGGVALGTALIWLGGASWLSLGGLALLGLALAPIFPSMIAITPTRLGPAHTSNGVGFQVAAAALGGALLPGAIGVLAQSLGLEAVGPVLVGAALLLVGLYELGEALAARRAPLAQASPRDA